MCTRRLPRNAGTPLPAPRNSPQVHRSPHPTHHCVRKGCPRQRVLNRQLPVAHAGQQGGHSRDQHADNHAWAGVALSRGAQQLQGGSGGVLVRPYVWKHARQCQPAKGDGTPERQQDPWCMQPATGWALCAAAKPSMHTTCRALRGCRRKTGASQPVSQCSQPRTCAQPEPMTMPTPRNKMSQGPNIFRRLPRSMACGQDGAQAAAGGCGTNKKSCRLRADAQAPPSCMLRRRPVAKPASGCVQVKSTQLCSPPATLPAGSACAGAAA